MKSPRPASLSTLRTLLAEAVELMDGLEAGGRRRPSTQALDSWRARVQAVGIDGKRGRRD